MVLVREKLYTVILFTCLVGYGWLFANVSLPGEHFSSSSPCIVKHIANIPCPSCGSTRSVIAFFQGHFLQSITINPIGLIGVLFLVIAPIWILMDLILGSQSFFMFYKKTEEQLRKPLFALPLIFLLLLNWIWNITKGL